MREVPLNGKKAAGRIALIDDEDYELIISYNWRIRYFQTSGPYADGAPKGAGRGAKRILMHILIMGVPGIDHKNHDGLDNRRSNLRLANHVQNAQNQRRHRDGSSQYKGVRLRSWGTWQARIRVEGRNKTLGSFASEEEAARAYDAAARKAFGEYAFLNFPEGCGSQ